MFTLQQRYAGLSEAFTHQAKRITELLEQRKLDEAEHILITALTQAPGHHELLRLQGVTHYLRGHNEDATSTLLQARAACPDDPMIHDALGSCYEVVHDETRARAALHRACVLEPDNPQFWCNYANRVNADGDLRSAAAALDKALALAPKNVQAWGLRASMAIAEGRRKEGEELYRCITNETPHEAGMIWWSLATLKPMPLTDEDIATMQRIFDDPVTSAANRAAVGFALAIGLEHQGRFEEAFHALHTAHGVAKANGKLYERDCLSAFVDEMLDVFDKPAGGVLAQQGDEVIFVVSMPRSGSTMTEQILASHSQVEGGGELSDISQLLQDESVRCDKPFPGWGRDLTTTQWRVLGQRYLARTRRWRKQRPRFTDKHPGNWLNVGAILAMLPKARVVVVRRDRLENCLGCYRYMVTHDYTHDFADLAAAWNDFDRAVRHWQGLYPNRVYLQQYEDLVADPETHIRRLLAFCDLPFEEACLNFHATERRVATPSATQVREPIRKDTARAHKYGALLDPLRAELGLPPFKA